MAVYPGAKWEPLPENETQGRITPTQIIYHTAVDHPGATNLRGYFARTDVKLESHFWVPNDGKTVQMMDTERRADANKNGNSRAISIETEDDGDPEGNPWNAAQIKALIELTKWLGVTHDIPMEVMHRWTEPGLGWHSMWGFKDGVNLTGGYTTNPWTGVRGKTCPGKTRIKQILNEILPALAVTIPDAKQPWEHIANASGSVFSAHVKAWQQRLGVWGYKVTVDGLIGPQTKGSHKAWSKKYAETSLEIPNVHHWNLLQKSPTAPAIKAVPNEVVTLKKQLKAANDLNKILTAQIVRAREALK